jgi:hypothetical protein
MNLTNVRGREWARTRIKAHIRKRPLYQFRHTYATLLLESGAQPQYVASQLGHTLLEMLFKVYSRWLRPPTSSALGELDRRMAIASFDPPKARCGPRDILRTVRGHARRCYRPRDLLYRCYLRYA